MMKSWISPLLPNNPKIKSVRRTTKKDKSHGITPAAGGFSVKKLAKDLHYLLDIPMTSKYTKSGGHYMAPEKGREIVQAIIKVLVSALQRDERVNIPGFGTFYTKWYNQSSGFEGIWNGEKFGYNKRTTSYMRAPRKRVRFKPSYHLSAYINQGGELNWNERRAMKTWKVAE